MSHLNSSYYRAAAWGGLFLTAVGAVLAGQRHGLEGLVFVALSVAAGTVFLLTPWIPAVYNLMLVIAMVLNAVATVWQLYDKIWWFDIAMHFYGGVSITPVLASFSWRWLAVRFPDRYTQVLVCICLGIFAGVLWEIAEWLGDLVLPGCCFMKGGMDTIGDLIMDSLGAIIGAYMIVESCRESKRGEAPLCQASGIW
jgi:hypothetical protein